MAVNKWLEEFKQVDALDRTEILPDDQSPFFQAGVRIFHIDLGGQDCEHPCYVANARVQAFCQDARPEDVLVEQLLSRLAGIGEGDKCKDGNQASQPDRDQGRHFGAQADVEPFPQQNALGPLLEPATPASGQDFEDFHIYFPSVSLVSLITGGGQVQYRVRLQYLQVPSASRFSYTPSNSPIDSVPLIGSSDRDP